MATVMSPAMPELRRDKHITYWLRCLKTYLPWQYTSMDSNRMSLACFTISALDLLNALESSTTVEERTGYIDWIYRCQHPDGGFRGSPATDFGHLSHPENAVWDPANIPATYFALVMLLILRDDFKRVKRKECLYWLTKMQRPDGSFGQTLGPNGSIEGGFDTRFAYLSMCIRLFLRNPSSTNDKHIPDVDIKNLTRRIASLQTYDGGFSDEPFHEAHGGYTYCAIGALSIIDAIDEGMQDKQLLLYFLTSRQTTLLEVDYDPSDDESDTFETGSLGSVEPIAGFNGRCNKPADTCYCWWIGATLKSLGHIELIDTQATTRFVLGETQHFIGGFGKLAGDPPDIYHSFMGLASLAVLNYPGLKSIHSAACISMDTMAYLEELRNGFL